MNSGFVTALRLPLAGNPTQVFQSEVHTSRALGMGDWPRLDDASSTRSPLTITTFAN